MKRLLTFVTILIALLISTSASAQQSAPVTWRAIVKMTSEKEGVITLKARLEPGWHLYGTKLPAGGPVATTFDFSASKGIMMLSELKPSIEPKTVQDKMFGLTLNWWDADVTFKCRFKLVGKKQHIVAGTIRFMSCNDLTCSPPKTFDFYKELKD